MWMSLRSFSENGPGDTGCRGRGERMWGGEAGVLRGQVWEAEQESTEERAWGPSVNWGARWGAVCRRLHGRCGWC